MAGQKHRGPLAPSRARAAEKRRDALALRKAGASFRDIAGQLGVSVARAYTYVSEELAAVCHDAAEDLLSLEMERLNTLQMCLWPAVKQGDVQAIREARCIIETRARLCGLLRSPTVSVNTSVAVPQVPGSVLVIGGSKSEYIAGLRAARNELEPPPQPPMVAEFPASTDVDTPNGNNGHH